MEYEETDNRQRAKVWTRPTHFAHRRIGKVTDGPYYRIVFKNGDVYYAKSEEIEPKDYMQFRLPNGKVRGN